MEVPDCNTILSLRSAQNTALRSLYAHLDGALDFDDEVHDLKQHTPPSRIGAEMRWYRIGPIGPRICHAT